MPESLFYTNFATKFAAMLKYICFGSGSSGNCYYLFTEQTGIIIDAGISARALKKYFRDRNLSMNNIKCIFVTHDHADHVKSVGMLSEDLKIPVYTTAKVHEGIKNNYIVRPKIPEEHIHYLNKNETYSFGEFSILPFGVPHDSLDNIGFRIEYNGMVFSLMTDVGHVTDEMKKYITESDYIVLEANHDREMLLNGRYPKFLKERILSPTGHLSNKECGETIAENASERLKHLWLCHLSEDNNHPELARKTVVSILASYGIIADKDFRVEVLKRKTPSQIYDLRTELY